MKKQYGFKQECAMRYSHKNLIKKIFTSEKAVEGSVAQRKNNFLQRVIFVNKLNITNKFCKAFIIYSLFWNL